MKEDINEFMNQRVKACMVAWLSVMFDRRKTDIDIDTK